MEKHPGLRDYFSTQPMSVPSGVSGRHVGVFVKAPVAGEVKTRLGRAVGMARAAALYAAFAGDVLETVARVRDAALWVFHAPGEAALERCRRLVEPEWWSRFRVASQAGPSLGERMRAALEQMLSARHGKRPDPRQAAVLVGSDLPTLDAGRVEDALERLGEVDVVLGPAHDGGYYLIGVAAPHDALFEGIEWSTPGVLDETRRRCEALGLSYELLPPARDIDEAADLEALRDELERRARAGAPSPRRTEAALRGDPIDP